MNRSKLKSYAPKARKEFIQAVTDRAAFYGLTKDETQPVTVKGDVAIIGGKAFPRSVADKRAKLEDRIERLGPGGFERTMEAVAYTWFNRLVAIRYMELHGYLDHGYRVLSHPEGKATPEIVEHSEHGRYAAVYVYESLYKGSAFSVVKFHIQPHQATERAEELEAEATAKHAREIADDWATSPSEPWLNDGTSGRVRPS